MKWQQYKPIKLQLLVTEDRVPQTSSGGIFLTDKLPVAAELGFYTGVVLKESKNVQKGLQLSESLVGKRICHRKYFGEARRLKEPDEDGHLVFLIEASDVVAIIGEGITIDVI